VTGLDPRNELVLDTRALGLPRRAGSMVTVHRMVAAPESMGVAVAWVPEGSPIEVDLRLESVLEGVLVTGTARVGVDAECARCLEPVHWQEGVDFSELFVYPATDARGSVVEEPAGDDPQPMVQDDCIDLEGTLRDAVVLTLPLAPVCRQDCGGLCPQCGVRLDEAPGHVHQSTDPRWSALAGLLDPDQQ